MKIQNIKIICPFSPSEGITFSKDSYNTKFQDKIDFSPNQHRACNQPVSAAGGPSEERHLDYLVFFLTTVFEKDSERSSWLCERLFLASVFSISWLVTMNEKNNVISRAGAFLGDCVPDLVTVSWQEPGAPPVLFSCTMSTQRTSCAQHKVALSEEQQRAHSILGGSVGESCQQSPQPGPELPEENRTGAVQASRAQHANTAALYET